MDIWGILLYAGCCCGYPGIDRAEITGVSLDPLSQGNPSRDLTGGGESQAVVREGIFQAEGGNGAKDGESSSSSQTVGHSPLSAPAFASLNQPGNARKIGEWWYHHSP